MLRNCLAAALRHLARNRLYTAISVFGLGLGLWAALLAALILRSGYTHDHFISGYRNVYMLIYSMALPGTPRMYNGTSFSAMAARVQLQIPGIEGATRLGEQTLTLRAGAVSAKEPIYWADPNFFDLLPLPVVAGDPSRTLHRPDGVVIPRSIARKYFGRDDVVGQVLTLDDAVGSYGGQSDIGGPHPMVVGAVIEDLPPNGTQFETGIFASGMAAFSGLRRQDQAAAKALGTGSWVANVLTYVRLAPGTSITSVRQGLGPVMQEIMRGVLGSLPHAREMLGQLPMSPEAVRIDRIALHAGLHPDAPGRQRLILVLGAVVLLIACANFVGLLNARSAQRAPEVAVRKLAGAGRAVLALQFLAESTTYALAALLLAAALTEWSLPYANAFMQSAAQFDYQHDGWFLGGMLGGTLLLGALAGVWPALILSGLKPLTVLKGWATPSLSSTVAGGSLVALQFSIPIGLLVCAGVAYLQYAYATREALRVNTDQVLGIAAPCRAAFISELRALPGVRTAACSSVFLLSDLTNSMYGRGPQGRQVTVATIPAEPAVFGVFGLSPVAGRFPATLADGQYVINEAAVHTLGFASAQQAVGQKIQFGGGSEIVGVVRDFSLGTVDKRIPPTLYLNSPDAFNLITAKLAGHVIPETLTAIDALWTRTGGPGSLDRFFVDERIQLQYLSLMRQTEGFGIVAMAAALLACLGLLGFTASVAERRTREIGIRKALGADTRDVLRLLLWQFSKPVIWANLIAWPVTAYVMSRWLAGFAYHIPLPLWLFPTAAGAALLIALLTVSAHSILVARAKPIAALRYE